MKILLDACVWGGACSQIRSAGHDAIWAGDWDEDPGDEAILRKAHAEGRILITLDKDFGEIAVMKGFPHCGIIRLVEISARQQGAASILIINSHSEELLAGAIITAEPGRLRIRLG